MLCSTLRKIVVLILVAGLVSLQMANLVHANDPHPFTFAVTADMRNFSGEGSYNNPDYFRGAMEAINALGGSAFMLSPGDIDPVDDVKWTIESVMGTEYIWYPVVGNHELPGAGYESYYGGNMDLLRDYDYDQNGAGIPPDIVNTGPFGCPQTTYSFDYENAHFVVLNEYCDTDGDTATSGDVPDHLYNWLVDDLQATTQDYIFIFGHEPAFPQPDADNGRFRHDIDSLNQHPANRNRFWNLLRDAGVVAYICGHTHNYSAYYHDGVWQLDTGHARGAADTGAASTFLMINVEENMVTFDAYRDVHDGDYDYDDIIHSGTLYPPPAFIHFQDGASPDTGYSGTLDTVLSEEFLDSNYGNELACRVDGDDGNGNDLSTILYWDVSAIPTGSIVEGVTVTLNVFDPSNDTYQVYEMKRNWVESQTTWNVYSSGNTWQIPGALGSDDRGSAVLGTFAPSITGLYNINLNSDGVALVQSWVDDPASNHGFIIANGSAADGADFDSSEASTASARPKLTVRYSEIQPNSCYGDSEPDGDVDGRDLVQEINAGGSNIETFAAYFGRTNCQTIDAK